MRTLKPLEARRYWVFGTNNRMYKTFHTSTNRQRYSEITRLAAFTSASLSWMAFA